MQIIALTGLGQDADRQRTRDAGMNHHLIKPVGLDALHSELVRCEQLSPTTGFTIERRPTSRPLRHAPLLPDATHRSARV